MNREAMANKFIEHDDIPAWSGHSTSRNGNTEFELKYGEHEKVSMMQAMLGQNGPILEAGSGNCLLIVVYVQKLDAGLLIHLWRDDDLSEEAADLIRKPFEKYPQLCEEPIVGFVSCPSVIEMFPGQIPQSQGLIDSITRNARFHNINAAEDSEGGMGVSVFLNTATGKLIIQDDNGADSVIDYRTF